MWLAGLIEVVKHALLITGFVLVMMLVIEYLNVLTQGKWDRVVRGHRPAQVVLASFLGSTPGCLGAFACVSFYEHRVIGFGALVAAMIATCGDEAFVMLALFPGKALLLIAILFGLGIVTGFVVDVLMKGRKTQQDRHLEAYETVHEAPSCVHFSRHELVAQWRHCSPQRGLLTVFLVLFLLGVVTGEIGHHDLGVEPAHGPAQVHGPAPARAAAAHEHGHGQEWNWVRVTLVFASLVGLFIVATVPEHFLEEHLWRHLVRVHVWRIFLWTLGALLVMHVLLDHLQIEPLLKERPLPLLLVACLVGLIPQSGPHLVFVTLYAKGTLPFSVLLASCVVQDGHGMIPLLAHSRRGFLAVKAVNFVIGLALGLIGLAMEW